MFAGGTEFWLLTHGHMGTDHWVRLKLLPSSSGERPPEGSDDAADFVNRAPVPAFHFLRAVAGWGGGKYVGLCSFLWVPLLEGLCTGKARTTNFSGVPLVLKLLFWA